MGYRALFFVRTRAQGRMQQICNKIAPESKLSHDFIANVHFLLYLCPQILTA
jgi:hypothetical protein